MVCARQLKDHKFPSQPESGLQFVSTRPAPRCSRFTPNEQSPWTLDKAVKIFPTHPIASHIFLTPIECCAVEKVIGCAEYKAFSVALRGSRCPAGRGDSNAFIAFFLHEIVCHSVLARAPWPQQYDCRHLRACYLSAVEISDRKSEMDHTMSNLSVGECFPSPT